MRDVLNDPIQYYKNFNMVSEIDVAGTFIYNGMKDLDSIETFDYGSEVFTFLYSISVGIERLQKVLIVLLEKVSIGNIEEFEKKLITHSHAELHNRIKKHIKINFNSRQNEFLQVLNKFYKSYRYDRFNLNGQVKSEKVILMEYINKNLVNDEIEKNMFGDSINSREIKELLGRVIGSIAKAYYKEVYEAASKQNLYSYELRTGSKAEKVFLSQVRKDSLHEQIVNEQIALKEFLVFLINTKSRNSFYNFIKEIKPLDFDIDTANSYLEFICKGEIPSELVDEVEFLYCEANYSKERIENIECIGDERVQFDRYEICRLKEELELLIAGKNDSENIVNECFKILDGLHDEYEEEIDVIDKVRNICNGLIEENYNIDNNGLKDKIKVIYDEFIETFFHFEDENE